jgi:hypothetical protein
MPRSSRAALLASALALLAAPSAGAAKQCSTGDAATAASIIFGDGTEVVRTEEVAGLKTALVLQPYIAPGTRQRLVHAAGQWCSAEQGLNTAWLASGRTVGDGRALAATYAKLAAAPYFDGTTITSHTTAAGVHAITTHARTNGVTAAWVVKTDAQGVRSAKWTATGFGVKPFEAEIEGLTAYKGATETYERVAGKLVAKRGLPTREDLAIEAPAATLTYNTPDGWALHVVAGDTRQMPDVGQDAGNYEADKLTLRAVRRMVADNYQEFYGWGFRANWTAPKTRVVLLNGGSAIPASEKTGYIYMNDSVSPYCLACVFIADDFQIHMFQEVEEALGALGYSYPGADPYKVYSNIIGHEMFHNWQNNYYRPGGGRSTPGSYSEGTARFQESLHDYSEISHQTESLVYANDANGCNGALRVVGQLRGLPVLHPVVHERGARAVRQAHLRGHGAGRRGPAGPDPLQRPQEHAGDRDRDGASVRGERRRVRPRLHHRRGHDLRLAPRGRRRGAGLGQVPRAVDAGDRGGRRARAGDARHLGHRRP